MASISLSAADRCKFGTWCSFDDLNVLYVLFKKLIFLYNVHVLFNGGDNIILHHLKGVSGRDIACTV